MGLPEQFTQVVSGQAVSQQADYSKALKAWTRSASIYHKLDTELIVTATYQSRAFRRAYLRAYARSYLLDAKQRQKLRSSQEAQARRFHEFFLSAYIPDSQWNDLASPRSCWRLYLEVNQTVRLRPVDIRQIKKVTPLVSSFYPYVRPWERVYKVRFDAEEKQGGEFELRTLSLVITGPRGKARMTWEMGPGSPPPSAGQ